jgi:hypothetical protein
VDGSTSYLEPSAGFWVTLLVLGLFLVALLAMPLWEAARARRPVWALAIVFLFPLGGLLWAVVGRWSRRARASRYPQHPRQDSNPGPAG